MSRIRPPAVIDSIRLLSSTIVGPSCRIAESSEGSALICGAVPLSLSLYLARALTSSPAFPPPTAPTSATPSQQLASSGSSVARPSAASPSGSAAPLPQESSSLAGLPTVEELMQRAASGAPTAVFSKPGTKARARLEANLTGPNFGQSLELRELARQLFLDDGQYPEALGQFQRLIIQSNHSDLQHYIVSSGVGTGLVRRLGPLFADFVRSQYSSQLDRYRSLVELADMRRPHLWFPFARAIQRKVVFHSGPTNSGKTYNAMQALKAASSGVYCGPLRLLAMEVYDRLNGEGVLCDLVTGQERRLVPGSAHVACTVEMAHLARRVDVAVVDEIQMIGDDRRGWAWSRALLGIPANEIHLCGDTSALDLVRQLCATTGEELEVRRYNRITELKVAGRALLDRGRPSDALRLVRPGDCIVAFSRSKIFAIKEAIEATTGLRVAVVYGALPPETRRQQARLFNEEGNGYDVLVASDAVGMGLNLNIGRVVFWEAKKYDREQRRQTPLSVSQVKQIAGRAGRFGTAFSSGEVTTVLPEDLRYVRECVAVPIEAMSTPRAGLYPDIDLLEKFAQHLPPEDAGVFHRVLRAFAAESQVDPCYFFCSLDSFLSVAEKIAEVEGLSLREQHSFSMAPVKTTDPHCMVALMNFARLYARGHAVPLEIQLPSEPPTHPDGLHDLESLHHVVSLWLWLSYRFEEGAFPGREAAEALTERMIRLMDEGLKNVRKAREEAFKANITATKVSRADFSGLQSRVASGTVEAESAAEIEAVRFGRRHTFPVGVVDSSLLSSSAVPDEEDDYSLEGAGPMGAGDGDGGERRRPAGGEADPRRRISLGAQTVLDGFYTKLQASGKGSMGAAGERKRSSRRDSSRGDSSRDREEECRSLRRAPSTDPDASAARPWASIPTSPPPPYPEVRSRPPSISGRLSPPSLSQPYGAAAMVRTEYPETTLREPPDYMAAHAWTFSSPSWAGGAAPMPVRRQTLSDSLVGGEGPEHSKRPGSESGPLSSDESLVFLDSGISLSQPLEEDPEGASYLEEGEEDALGLKGRREGEASGGRQHATTVVRGADELLSEGLEHSVRQLGDRRAASSRPLLAGDMARRLLVLARAQKFVLVRKAEARVWEEATSGAAEGSPVDRAEAWAAYTAGRASKGGYIVSWAGQISSPALPVPLRRASKVHGKETICQQAVELGSIDLDSGRLAAATRALRGDVLPRENHLEPEGAYLFWALLKFLPMYGSTRDHSHLWAGAFPPSWASGGSVFSSLNERDVRRGTSGGIDSEYSNKASRRAPGPSLQIPQGTAAAEGTTFDLSPDDVKSLLVSFSSAGGVVRPSLSLKGAGGGQQQGVLGQNQDPPSSAAAAAAGFGGATWTGGNRPGRFTDSRTGSAFGAAPAASQVSVDNT